MNSTLDIPLQKVYVHNRFLGKELSGVTKGYWYAITSIPHRAFICHVMLENGANWAGLPLNALASIPVATETTLQICQSYDCFSYDAQVIRHHFLRDQTAKCLRTNLKGRYLFTVHSVDPEGKAPFAEFPEQTKTFTFIESEIGAILARPNNYLRWQDKALYDTESKIPRYERNSVIHWSEE